MNTAVSYDCNGVEALNTRMVASKEPTILTDIYREDINMAIWQRELPKDLQQAIENFLTANSSFKTSMTVTPESAFASIKEALGQAECSTELSKNIANLVDMFCCLFELKRVGLRLTALNNPMCPRFHVDHVPCRLITTFSGVATQWLPHHLVDRSKLGRGNGGLPDEQSGIFHNQQDIYQLAAGDVALLKGERWEGNEGAGLVHRSPFVSSNQLRLLLTLDFIN